MNLFQSDLSAYASRCRIQMYAKGIDDIEMCEMTTALKARMGGA